MQAEEPIVAYESLDQSKLYTYWDYLKWQFAERVELIKGKILKMSPAPLRVHQQILMTLSAALFRTFQGKQCEIYPAPFDVRLPIPNSTKDSTVVQPDICVVCDKRMLDERGCNGAPDLVVEIVSPQNSRHDTVTKFELYQVSGVQEYWIVQPETRHIFIYTLVDGKYIGLPPLTEGQTLKSTLFPALEIEVSDIFPD